MRRRIERPRMAHAAFPLANHFPAKPQTKLQAVGNLADRGHCGTAVGHTLAGYTQKVAQKLSSREVSCVRHFSTLSRPGAKLELFYSWVRRRGQRFYPRSLIVA